MLHLNMNSLQFSLIKQAGYDSYMTSQQIGAQEIVVFTMCWFETILSSPCDCQQLKLKVNTHKLNICMCDLKWYTAKHGKHTMHSTSKKVLILCTNAIFRAHVKHIVTLHERTFDGLVQIIFLIPITWHRKPIRNNFNDYFAGDMMWMVNLYVDIQMRGDFCGRHCQTCIREKELLFYSILLTLLIWDPIDKSRSV